MGVPVHHLTKNPTSAWKELSKTQRVIKIQVTSPKSEIPSDKVRIVCMSDTHSLTPHIKFDVPPGDIFIHAGDFTRCGRLEEVIDFNNWIGQLPHKYKIVIAGNHELSFDTTFTHPLGSSPGDRSSHTGHSIIDYIPNMGIPKDKLKEAINTPNVKDYLTNCIYLEDSEIILFGLKIYGSPWSKELIPLTHELSQKKLVLLGDITGFCLSRAEQGDQVGRATNPAERQPEFCKWAFSVPRGEECLKKWDKIPDDTDILVTHTPPIGHGDLCCSGVRAGCVELLATVQQRVKPKYHVFGHIHEGYGISSDGRVIYINASTCDLNYLPTNPPVVFDITLPEGNKK